MDLVSRLDGYVNHQITHANPIPFLPSAKNIKDKKDTTLLQMALKGLLKERMYGNLQNFQTQNILNKNHLRMRVNSIVQKRNDHQSLDEPSILKNSSKPSKNTKNQSILFLKEKKNELTSTKRPTTKKQLAKISSTFDIYSKTKRQQNSPLEMTEKRAKLADGVNLQKLRHLYDQNQNNNHTHFISSIEFLETEKSITSKNKKTQQKGIKLPEITDKRRTKISRTQNVKIISKALFKQTQQRLYVKQQFWSFICVKKDNMRIRKNKQMTIKKNQTNRNLLQESISRSNVGKRSVSIEGSIYGGANGQNQKVNTQYNQNLLFKRQNFINFLANQKFTIPQFVLKILNFFQISNKINDKIIKTQFESIFVELFNYSDRAWCFVIFNFFDSNKNTKIDSSDLFKIYNLIDQCKSTAEKHLNLLLEMERQKTSEENDGINQKQQKNKRQKTITSQNGSVSQRTTKKRKLSIVSIVENSIKNKSFDFLENQQNQISLIKNNLENITQFQKQIRLLNQLNIEKKNVSSSHESRYENPQVVRQYSNNKNQSVTQRSYLQQGLLGKEDVKISDISTILQQGLQQNSTKKKTVLDIDHKKLNIKLSSAYVQTFIAMNHNEETRMNRQHLQNLKQKVKAMSNQQRQGYNYSPGIQYTQFYEQKLFKPFKQLFFAFMQLVI